MSVPWPAPAKINLFLHVTGRRADGYHELQTAFQFLDLADSLEIEPLAGPQILRAGGPAGVPEAADLTVRAARALQQAAGSRRGARIRASKRIPAGGGLGGGSSDAATVLVALNALWGCGLSTAELARIGLALGADVPVFVHGRAAFAEGVGERLQVVDFPERWALVVHPGVAVSTAEIFSAPDLTRNTAPMTMRAILAGGGRNDCEAVARRRFPAIEEAMSWLGRRARATLTGTGACLFAIFPEREEAERICAELPSKWQAFVCRTLNRSPLLERLAGDPPLR